MATIYTEIHNKIQAEIADVKEVLASGAAVDYPNYQLLVGTISGLNRADQTIKHIIKSRLEED